MIIFWGGSGNFLGHEFTFSPLGCAWSFVVGKSLKNPFFKIKHRIWIVESICLNFIPHAWILLHKSFSEMFAVQDFLFLEIAHPPPPSPLQKIMVHSFPKEQDSQAIYFLTFPLVANWKVNSAVRKSAVCKCISPDGLGHFVSLAGHEGGSQCNVQREESQLWAEHTSTFHSTQTWYLSLV